MFITALFTIAKLWQQPRCPMTDEWIKKMWYLYTMELYSTIKKNDILLFAGKWMELENIILSEVSQVQKVKCHMFSLICGMKAQYKYKQYYICLCIYNIHISMYIKYTYTACIQKQDW
jgi:hypothetical protein